MAGTVGDTTGEKRPAPEDTGAKDRPWELRVWTGMNVTGWLGLLSRNRFAVAPRRVAMTLVIAVISVFNSFLWIVQTLLYGRKIARTEINHDPLFIIGHWRTGTTLLHELLVLDPRHTYPSSYACFAPNHFLLSAPFITWWLRLLLPRRRPMDNMAVGWDRPQEDELALCNMGVPSPYLTWVFPNRPPQCQEYLDLRRLSPAALARWKEAFLWFLKCVTVRNPRRIVLKSPPHTCRIKVLLELFPNARFVHIVRDPYVVFPSTINTWKRLYRYHGAQVPRYEGLEEYVFETFNHMFEVFEQDRELIDPSRFCEVRYEDLIEDPIGRMRSIYDKLGLGQFDTVLPALRQYVAQMAQYKTNRYELPLQTREEIARRWGAYLRKYGYESRGQGSGVRGQAEGRNPQSRIPSSEPRAPSPEPPTPSPDP